MSHDNNSGGWKSEGPTLSRGFASAKWHCMCLRWFDITVISWQSNPWPEKRRLFCLLRSEWYVNTVQILRNRGYRQAERNKRDRHLAPNKISVTATRGKIIDFLWKMNWIFLIAFHIFKTVFGMFLWVNGICKWQSPYKQCVFIREAQGTLVSTRTISQDTWVWLPALLLRGRDATPKPFPFSRPGFYYVCKVRKW